MRLVYIGELVNTHGLKGEVRIISSFKYKEDVFKKDNNLYILNNPLKIKTYRVHKNYDMVTFEGINRIEDVLMYKGEEVYVDRDEFDFGVINDDLIGLDVYDDDKLIGKVDSIMSGPNQEILVIKSKNKKHLVPNVLNFIKKVDIDEKKIYINVIEGLLDEN